MSSVDTVANEAERQPSPGSHAPGPSMLDLPLDLWERIPLRLRDVGDLTRTCKPLSGLLQRPQVVYNASVRDVRSSLAAVRVVAAANKLADLPQLVEAAMVCPTWRPRVAVEGIASLLATHDHARAAILDALLHIARANPICYSSSAAVKQLAKMDLPDIDSLLVELAAHGYVAGERDIFRLALSRVAATELGQRYKRAPRPHDPLRRGLIHVADASSTLSDARRIAKDALRGIFSTEYA